MTPKSASRGGALEARGVGRNEKSIFTLIARARQLPRAHKRHSSQHLLSRGVHGIYCSTHPTIRIRGAKKILYGIRPFLGLVWNTYSCIPCVFHRIPRISGRIPTFQRSFGIRGIRIQHVGSLSTCGPTPAYRKQIRCIGFRYTSLEYLGDRFR